MKKVHSLLLLAFMLMAIKSSAQINYLFSATSRPYVPVTGGTSPHLVSDYTAWEVEDEGFARIPIGFTFNYEGENYTKANVDVNGFITLKDSLNIFYNYPYFINNLRSGPPYNKRPVIAAFWDDLLLADTLDLVYKTTGHAPFRVFTIEWKKAKWVYESLAPVLSIELKLYETTNIIEFHYKDEGSLPDARYAFASIGITSSYANRDFISLQSASSHPEISLVKAMDSLNVKPADNQVYRFTPALPQIPASLRNSMKYTNNSVSFKLNSGAFGYYEYALTHSPIPPSSGVKTFNPNVTISSLSPATTYYIYARSKWFSWFNSQWICDSFTTASNLVALPYHVGGNPAVYPYLPADMRIQDFADTSFHFYPNSDGAWNAVVDFPNIGDTSLYALNTLNGYNGDTWVFTPGLKLTEGKTYQLKFGYLSYASQVFGPTEFSSIEVKYGRATGAAAMTSGTLFKKTDILTPFNETGWIDFVDTAIEVRPRHSGIYYFGLHNLTTLDNGEPGPVPVVGNISITEKTPACETPLVLAGRTNNSGNVLNWANKDNKITGSFEMQRSDDGINFKKIGDVPGNTMSPLKNPTTFRIYRDKEKPVIVNSRDKNSKAFDDHARFELQRSDDGINFKKHSGSISKNSDKAAVKIDYDFIDHNSNGTNYYRVRQVNKNGKAIYSNVVALNNSAQVSGFKVYPNPAKDVLNVTMPFSTNKEITLLVTDNSGKTILNKVTRGIKGDSIVQLDISHLATGTYFLKLMCADGCENAVTKFVKQ